MIDSFNTKQMFSRWAQTSTGMLEPFIQLNQLTLQTMERMAELQIEAGREYIELQKQQLDRFSKAQDLNDFTSSQENLATDFASTLNHHLEKLQKIGGDTQQAYADWVQNVVEKAASQAGETLHEVTKSAGETMRKATQDVRTATRATAAEAKRASAGK
ncbi:MAG: phasin family protein [Gammaproteobacteria bacterium]